MTCLPKLHTNHTTTSVYTQACCDTDLAVLQHAQEATIHTASPSSSLSLSSPSPPPQDGNNEMHKRKRKWEKEQRPSSSSSVPLTTANDTHDAQAAYATSPTPVLNNMPFSL